MVYHRRPNRFPNHIQYRKRAVLTLESLAKEDILTLQDRSGTGIPLDANATASALLAPLKDLRLLILAPPQADIPADFQTVKCNAQQHSTLLAQMQRLRGKVYLEDGAIQSRQLSGDGRHCQPIDLASWHLLSLDRAGEICGCVRYFSHRNTAAFQDLWVRNSAIAMSSEWGPSFRAAVENDLRQAHRRGVSFVEVGGWAISPERRCSPDALRTALATYSFARVLGGCIGITTATVRHCSSSILRRLGGGSLEGPRGKLPPYYDPQYECEMEVLRFDSERPASRFLAMIERLCSDITNIPVIGESVRHRIWSLVPSQKGFGPCDTRLDSRYALQGA